MLFNLHTHNDSDADASISILSVAVRGADAAVPSSFCSVGIHPWHIHGDDTEVSLATVERLAAADSVVAIGECGLDRAIGTHIDVQTEVFLAQVRIAQRFRKPVIIHSVRANSDILGLRRHSDDTLPWIIHGYTGGSDMAHRLIDKGIVLSFGAALLDERRNVGDVFAMLPLDSVFLETDESGIGIGQVYRAAAEIRGINLTLLIAAIDENISRIFPGIAQSSKGAAR